MREIPEITEAELVFPANPPLPERDEIPEEFWRPSSWYAQTAQDLFMHGGRLTDHGIDLRSDLDEEQRQNAFRALQACLGSFAPKHEHKIAGVAYLLSEWCEPAEESTDATG